MQLTAKQHQALDRAQSLIEQVDTMVQQALPDSIELRNLHDKLWDIIEDIELTKENSNA
jgi:hypothetical protein